MAAGNTDIEINSGKGAASKERQGRPRKQMKLSPGRKRKILSICSPELFHQEAEGLNGKKTSAF
jgi:hypothetical protein